MAKGKTETEAMPSITPAPAPGEFATADGVRWDPAAAAARQRERMSAIELVTAAEDRLHIGKWYGEPFRRYPEMNAWHFFRCGLRHDDGAQAHAWNLRQMGWEEAPREVRCRGFEGDGEQMLVMYAIPEVFARTHEAKARRQKGAQSARKGNWDKSLSELADITGYQPEVRGGEGEGTLDDYAEAQRRAR
jgi:hypothetical protein